MGSGRQLCVLSLAVLALVGCGRRKQVPLFPEPDAASDAGGEDVDCQCQPGETRCDGSEVAICAPSCLEWVNRACPPEQTCKEGACWERVCQRGSFTCLNDTVQRLCSADGTMWEDVPCPAGQVCIEGQCQERICPPGKAECVDRLKVRRCNPQGTAWEEEACPSQSLCAGPEDCEGFEGIGCRRIICNPGDQRCSPDDETAVDLCEGGGTCWRAMSCGADRVCVGNGCKDLVCVPDEVRCLEGTPDTVVLCDDTGTRDERVQCDEGLVCVDGTCQPCLCQPAFSRCVGPDIVETCRLDCIGWDASLCEDGQVCAVLGVGSMGTCHDVVCAPNSRVCDGQRTVAVCNDTGTAVSSVQCDVNLVCHRARCRPRACDRNQVRCVSLNVQERCNGDQTGWNLDLCDAGHSCERGGCSPRLRCVAGEARCENVTTREVCSPGRTFWARATCAQGSLCEEGECRPLVCDPGERRCLDPLTVGRCNAHGTAFVRDDDCDDHAAMQTCRAGRCESACEQRAALNSTDGCEFVVPDLVPFLPDGGSLRVAVANGSPAPAQIRVEIQGQMGTVATYEVQSVSGQVIELAGGTIEGSGVAPGAYRLISTVPIFATLLFGVDVDGAPAPAAATRLPQAPMETPDGSRHRGAFGQDFLVATWPPTAEAHGTVTVVGPGREVGLEVIPSVPLAAGGDLVAGEPGVPMEVVLAAGEVLHLWTAEPGADPTGTRVQADDDVMVYAGTASAAAPHGDGAPCCDDPIAHHVPPLPTWGALHAALPTAGREEDADGQDLWRVVAGEDDVVVSTEPDLGVDVELMAGQALELVPAAEPFLVMTSGAALLLRMSTGRDELGQGDGTPALAVMAPTDQTAGRIAFLVPDLPGTHWLDLVREIGAVTVDAVPIGRHRWDAIGRSDYEWLRMEVDPGYHLVEAARGASATLVSLGEETAWAVPLAYEANVVVWPEPEPAEGEGEGEGE